MATHDRSSGTGTEVDQKHGRLKGLEGDLCQCPHWGYIIEGKVTVGFADGHSEIASESDLFYWPPGHTVKAEKDTEMILFSPQHEHGEVISHVIEKLGV